MGGTVRSRPWGRNSTRALGFHHIAELRAVQSTEQQIGEGYRSKGGEEHEGVPYGVSKHQSLQKPSCMLVEWQSCVHERGLITLVFVYFRTSTARFYLLWLVVCLSSSCDQAWLPQKHLSYWHSLLGWHTCHYTGRSESSSFFFCLDFSSVWAGLLRIERAAVKHFHNIYILFCFFISSVPLQHLGWFSIFDMEK